MLKNYKNNIIWKLIQAIFLYPAPGNLNYWWNYGVLALFCLVMQVATGIFLAMYYLPDGELAFQSIEYMVRNVNYGWLWRYTHANGASFFFLVVYIHVFRNIFYQNFSIPREKVWSSGVIILLIMILTAFLGYVLPWGQMSFWAATVITNLSSVIPFFGALIIVWIWGGYAIDSATLNRFFSFHFVFPFILFLLIFLHIYFLHEVHSGSPDTLLSWLKKLRSAENMTFYPYYFIKDTLGLQIFFLFFFLFLFFAPNVMGHSDNYIPANPLVTPTHIVPEWYFLPFYAILRSVPNKLFGVMGLLLSILILFVLPWTFSNLLKGAPFNPKLILLFWLFFGSAVILGWIGQNSVELEYLILGRSSSLGYFIYFLFLVETLNSYYNYLTEKKKANTEIIFSLNWYLNLKSSFINWCLNLKPRCDRYFNQLLNRIWWHHNIVLLRELYTGKHIYIYYAK